MSDAAPFPTLPPGALGVIKTTTGVGSIAAPAAGRLYHIVTLSLHAIAQATDGGLTISVTPYNGVNSVFATIHCGAVVSVAHNVVYYLGDLPTTSIISVTGFGTTPVTLRVNAYGWEEALP